jgi:hypothetical protein
MVKGPSHTGPVNGDRFKDWYGLRVDQDRVVSRRARHFSRYITCELGNLSTQSQRVTEIGLLLFRKEPRGDVVERRDPPGPEHIAAMSNCVNSRTGGCEATEEIPLYI